MFIYFVAALNQSSDFYAYAIACLHMPPFFRFPKRLTDLLAHCMHARMHLRILTFAVRHQQAGRTPI